MKFSVIDFKVLLVLWCTSVLIEGKPKPTLIKNCNKDDFNTHSSNIFGQFGLDELKFPESSSQLTNYCQKAKEGTEFGKQYGQNCLKGTSQTLMALAAYNFEQVNKQYCAKNGKLKNEFVKWGQCGNKAKVKTERCWDKMVVTMAMIHKVKNSKSRIPISCCTYYEWIKCTRKALEDMGAATCPASYVEGYSVHINKASVDSMNLICSKYEDDPVKCGNLLKEVPAGRPKKLDKLPLLYVFDIFDKL